MRERMKEIETERRDKKERVEDRERKKKKVTA